MIFLLAGLIPLAVGNWLHDVIMNDPYVFPTGAVRGAGFMVLAIWFVLGFLAYKLLTKKTEALVLINFVPMVVFAYMLAWQFRIINFPFTFPRLNLQMQFYTLPLARFTGSIVRWLPHFGWVSSLTYITLLAVAVMTVTSWLGWFAGRKIWQKS